MHSLSHNRLTIISEVKDAFATLSFKSKPKHSKKVLISEIDPKVEMYCTPETNLECHDTSIYNMPFLFNSDYSPWIEANDYLLELIQNTSPMNRPTDDARKKASKLIDYKIYLDENGIDWLDFSGRRVTHRPTYKYFHHLVRERNLSPAVINQYTSVIYEFYKYVSKHFHPIDMDRVDSVKQVKALITTGSGSHLIDYTKRSQTLRTGSVSPVKIGHVRDEGEDLRPLTNKQLSELIEIISSNKWSQQERLIFQTAYMTGARKQSILTLRMKHIENLKPEHLENDGTYKIKAGPGTLIDTKYDKKGFIHLPKQLAEDLLVYTNSKVAKERRGKFYQRFGKNLIPQADMYLFLSDQGQCYYMAKSDPRYYKVKTKPIGQVTRTLTTKLEKWTSNEFPSAFVFHWLRATFAYQYYQFLKPLVDGGNLSPTELITLVQRRLCHSKRETTEHYLKLFENVDELFDSQNTYEGNVFGVSAPDA